jgi:hypothetical protein
LLPFKISGRPDDGHAHVGRDAHGNHSLGDSLARTHAGVYLSATMSVRP